MNTAAAHTADGAGSPVNVLARAALAGAATGARSFTGLAALTLATPPGPVTQPDRSLGKTWVKGLITLAASQELVMDTLMREVKDDDVQMRLVEHAYPFGTHAAADRRAAREYLLIGQ